MTLSGHRNAYLLENFRLLVADPLTVHLFAEIRRPAFLPQLNNAE